jgi:hypothetical protein
MCRPRFLVVAPSWEWSASFPGRFITKGKRRRCPLAMRLRTRKTMRKIGEARENNNNKN